MLRRGERLRADRYELPGTIAGSSDMSLESQWSKWIDQESAKRLVCFATISDFHVAAARKINTVFNYDEINTPLPSSTRLWEASSAAEWLRILDRDAALRMQQPVSLNRVLRSPRLLARNVALVDQAAATGAYLAGFWILIGEYWRMTAIMTGKPASTDFVLNARHSELTSALELFKTEVTEPHETGTENVIMQELISLHLHVSVHEVAQYCGKGTEEDARASAAFVQRWCQTPRARTAVWHAGQIIRACRLLPPGALADVYVVALYHAGLVLWIWGLLCKVQSVGQSYDGQRAIMDGEESSETIRFIKTGRCRPCLTEQRGNVVLIETATVVPDLVNSIVSANWNHEPMPSTTNQLFGFMDGIGKVSKQKFGSGA